MFSNLLGVRISQTFSQIIPCLKKVVRVAEKMRVSRILEVVDRKKNEWTMSFTFEIQGVEVVPVLISSNVTAVYRVIRSSRL